MDELEKALFTGIHGSPELKKAEKLQYLGEFRERVLKAITKAEAAAKQLNVEVEAAINDPRAQAIIIHGDLSAQEYGKYKELADRRSLDFTIRYDPEFTGDIGLIVVTDEAVI